MAETFTVGELLIRLRADTSQLEQALSTSQRSVESFGGRGAPSVARLEHAFRMLAVQAAGVPGPLARITTLLSGFLPGGLLTAGILAGLGAIALAWDKIAKHAGDATKAAEEAAKALLQAPQRQVIQGQMATAQRKFDDLIGQRDRLDALNKAGFFLFKPGEFQEQLNTLNMQIQRWRGVLIAGREKLREELGKGAVTLPEILVTPPLADPKRPHVPPTLFAMFEGFEQIADAVTRQKELQDKFNRVGRTIGSWITAGLESALNRGFGSFLRSLAFFVLEQAIGTAIGGALAGPAGAAAGAALPVGHRVSTHGLGGLTVVVGDAKDPITIARDRQWISALKESLLVAQGGGFRLAGQ